MLTSSLPGLLAHPPFSLEQGLSKCGPQTNNISISWEPVRYANLPWRLPESETLWVGPSNLCLNKPSQWFSCVPDFENHSLRVHPHLNSVLSHGPPSWGLLSKTSTWNRKSSHLKICSCQLLLKTASFSTGSNPLDWEGLPPHGTTAMDLHRLTLGLSHTYWPVCVGQSGHLTLLSRI